MRTFDNIDALMKQQGIKQTELCNYLGISKNRYTDWKSGRINSYVKYLPQIAEYLGVTVEFLTSDYEVYDEIEEYSRYIASILKQKQGELKLKIIFMKLGMSEEDAEINVDLAKNNFEYDQAISNGVPQEEAKKILYTIEPYIFTEEESNKIEAKKKFNQEHPEIRLKRIEELKLLLEEG